MTPRNANSSNTFVADLLIVGGGLVGSTLAIALANKNLKIIVVDQTPLSQAENQNDLRTTALSYASSQIYRALGLWNQIEPDTEPILDICVSESISPAILHYTYQDVEINAPMGYMVNNYDLRNHLHLALGKCANVTCIAPTTLEKLEVSGSSVIAQLGNGQTIKARLCVGADGRNSKTRTLCNLPVTRWNYAQSALICTVAHEKSHQNVAHERFLESGPFAVLPLRGHCSGIVWSCSHEKANHLGKMTDDALLEALQHVCGDTLGKLVNVTPRQVYPLSVLLARRFISKRVSLVGDAAHVMHPVAGQGLNVGLRDAAALAEIVLDSHQLGLDIGNQQGLEKYQRWRRFDVLSFIAMTDILVRAFGLQTSPARFLRSLGIQTVNKFPVLKRLLTRHAMGVTGNKPKLTQGLHL